MRTQDNKLIAKYEGHIINWGFGKNKVLINDIAVVETELKYHENWNSLMPAVKKALGSENQNQEWENLCAAMLSCDIKDVYEALIEFIETELDKSEILKTHFFAITDEDGRTAGVIKARNDNDFTEGLELCIREHHCVDEVRFTPLNLNDFIGENKTETFSCKIDEEPIFYDMRIESVLIY